jgi:hypothetical protein
MSVLTRRGVLLSAIVVLAGTFAATAGAQDAAGLKEVRLRPSLEPLTNPERGFYKMTMSQRVGNLDALRGEGISLVLVEIDLGGFKDRELSQAKLDELRRAFEEVRKSGLKMIARAAYGFTGQDYYADPKDMGRIVGHIRQLGVVFAENQDVLWGVQAGFLGPWGEWHGSNWGNPPSLEARRSVLFALLDSIPEPITVHVRRPMFIRDLFASEPGGSTLTARTAYSGSRLSRTGWHDDALAALPTDMGTFAKEGWSRNRELAWCANHGRYTPFGGETVPGSVDTPIDQVVRELEQLHATYLHSDWEPTTLNRWREVDYQGENAYRHIERRLGYRFVAEWMKYTPVVAPGGSFRLTLTLRNAGFASPHMPRPVELVLTRGGRTLRSVVSEADPRRWDPEAGAVTIETRLLVPADAPRGSWRAALVLPDPSPRLRADGRYAIRLGNQDVPFEESTGLNVLAVDVEVR